MKKMGQFYLTIYNSNEEFCFGQYQWYVIGRVDKLDKNVVLGLFPYLGPSGQNEIDIEMTKWGNVYGKMGNFTVWPAKKVLPKTTKPFSVSLNGDYTTHGFNWQSTSVFFQMLHGHRIDNQYEIWNWYFKPLRYLDYIPQLPMQTHMNLRLFKDRPPSDGKEVEIIVKSFQFKK
jgi:hypothetical protein